jgi:rhodanese-related sulfurtransferase
MRRILVLTLRYAPARLCVAALLLFALAGLAACGGLATSSATPTAVSLPAPVGTPGGALPAAVPTGNAVPAAVATGGTGAQDFPPSISKEELRALLDKQAVLLLDVRDVASYNTGHIKGAISFPFETLDKHYSELPKDKTIVAYCSCPEDEEGISVAARLHTYGFSYTYVKYLEGGTRAWQAAGWPMEGTDITPTTSTP